MNTQGGGITRRHCLGALCGAAVGMTVAGCSGSSDGAKAVRSQTGSSQAAPPTSASATPSDGDGGVLAPEHPITQRSVPSREEILARFGGRRPKAWALNLPGETTRIAAAGHAVALTFDACGGKGGSGYDEKLIELLRTHQVKATLMLNSRWIRTNHSVAMELAADPLFRLGNHGVTHRPLSTTPRRAYTIPGTGSLGALYDEVRGAHDWIASVQPQGTAYFRSGTAFSDDIGVDVCKAMGAPFLGFTLNGDAGATFTAAQIHDTLLTVKAGDVVISHMNQPTHATARGYASVLPKLLDHGVTFHHLTA